jgi:hypothetical protein
MCVLQKININCFFFFNVYITVFFFIILYAFKQVKINIVWKSLYPSWSRDVLHRLFWKSFTIDCACIIIKLCVSMSYIVKTHYISYTARRFVSFDHNNQNLSKTRKSLTWRDTLLTIICNNYRSLSLVHHKSFR